MLAGKVIIRSLLWKEDKISCSKDLLLENEQPRFQDLRDLYKLPAGRFFSFQFTLVPKEPFGAYYPAFGKFSGSGKNCKRFGNEDSSGQQMFIKILMTSAA